MVCKKYFRTISVVLMAVAALSLGLLVNGCSSGHSDGGGTGVDLRSLAFYPEGSCIINNVVMDATKTVEVNRITAVEVDKSSSPLRFVLVGTDANNKRYVVTNTSHTDVNWANSADYSKYVKIGKDKRSLEYVASNSAVMVLVAAYKATSSSAPVQATLDVTTVDGSEQIKAIEFYPAQCTISESDPNLVVDKDGYPAEPIIGMNIDKHNSPMSFVAVAVFASSRGILTNTEHVTVDWKDGADYDQYAVIGSDNRSVYFVKAHEEVMPLVVEYYRDLKSDTPTVTNTLEICTLNS